jgi:tetratricopeptide (TPR) repeat protein
MKVLSHGMPFFRTPLLLNLSGARHEVRTIRADEGADYIYDPATESLDDILARIGKEWTPDLLLFWFPENDPPPFGVENSPIPTVAMAGDWNLFYPALHVNLSRYDHVLCDKGAVEIFQSDLVSPTHLFPLYAQHPEVHKKLDVPKGIDVFFAGSMNFARYPERGRVLEKLARLGGKYNVIIVDNVFGAGYNQLLNRSRIVFNHSVRRELNLRTFETIAAGSLPFVESSNLEVRDWFTDGEDIVLYDEDNFDDVIAYYLAHPEKGEEIAARAHERMEEFSPQTRIEQLIDWASARGAGPRKFRDLPEEEQTLQTTVMYNASENPVYRSVDKIQLRQIVRVAPNCPRAWSCVGKILLGEQIGVPTPSQIEAGLKALKRAATLSPDSAPAMFNIASVYANIGEDELAAEYHQKTIERDGEDLGPSLLGWIHAPREWWSHCRTWNASLLAMARRKPFIHILHAEAHIQLARRAVRLGRYDEALKSLDRAENLDHCNFLRILVKSEALNSLERNAEAAQTLWEGREAFQLDLKFRENLIAALEQAGGNATMLEQYRQETMVMSNVLHSSALVAKAANDLPF